jgi:hypothetical protein
VTTRRGFLSLLVAAPFAAPAVAQAAAAERYSGVVAQLGFSIAEYKPAAVSPCNRKCCAPCDCYASQRDQPVQPTLPQPVTAQEVVLLVADDPHDPVPDYFC